MWSALGFFVLLLAAPAMAQNTTATLRLELSSARRDRGRRAPYYAVNANDGFSAKGTARADGSHLLTGLEPGEYVVTATPPGGKEVYRTITVHVGQTADLDINLAEDKPVSISARERPSSSAGRSSSCSPRSEVATNVSRAEIEPASRAAATSSTSRCSRPASAVSTDEFNRNFSSGARGANTNVFVDGVSLKNNVIEGGCVGQDSSRGNPFPQLAVSGFRVHHPELQGRVRAGRQRHHLRDHALGRQRAPRRPLRSLPEPGTWWPRILRREGGRSRSPTVRYQFGASVSGPIVKDKLFFFVTYEGNYQNRANQVTLGNPTRRPTWRGSASSRAAREPVPRAPRLRQADLAAGREPDVDLTASSSTETDIRSFGGPLSFETAENVRNNVFTRLGQAPAVRLGSLTNEATFQFLRSQFNPGAANPGLIGRGLRPASSGSAAATPTRTSASGAHAARRRDVSELRGLGQHVVKAGAKVSLQHYRVERTFFGNPVFRYRQDPGNNLSFDFRPRRLMASVTRRRRPTIRNSACTSRTTGRFQKRLTLNLGIRWDVETNPLNNNYVTPPDVRSAMEQLANIVAVTLMQRFDYNYQGTKLPCRKLTYMFHTPDVEHTIDTP